MRLPPAGERFRAAEIRVALGEADPAAALREGLRAALGAERISLHRSGREALRVVLCRLAERSGRNELLVPGYTCFSVPAAAVAAGLRVRLFDLTPDGRPDPESLAKLPRGGAAALLVSNLLGVPEPVAAFAGSLRADGIALIDDAAQCLGGSGTEGPVGARGDAAVLSFGRGKPLSALGGGAAAWWGDLAPSDGDRDAGRGGRLGAALRAAAYGAALSPSLFRLLAAIPALHVGETPYDPAFPRGGIDGAALRLAVGRLATLSAANRARSERALALARAVQEATRFAPLLAPPGCTGVYPRLGVLAPTPALRDAALARLAPLGASRLYPATLDRVAALRPHLAGEPSLPGARAFCERLLTLPTHAGLDPERRERLVGALGAL